MTVVSTSVGQQLLNTAYSQLIITATGAVSQDGQNIPAVYLQSGDHLSVLNAGLINSDQAVFGATNFDSVSNGSNGIIQGGSVGVYMQNGSSDSLSNDGHISGNYAVYLKTDTSPSITNTGTISGQINGIAVDGSTYASINNSGSITATNDTAIECYGTVDGISVANSGTISSNGSYGVFSTGSATINNTGMIYGTYFGVASSAGGVVTNAGTISGGVNLSGDYSVLHNTGHIDGGVYLGGTSGSAYLDGVGGTISGGVYGSENSDVFDLSHQTVTGNIVGDFGADTITGSAGADTIYGDYYYASTSDGNDVIDGGPGDDTLYGGGGVNTLSYQSATAGVSVNLVQGVANGGGGSDTFTQFQNVVASRYADVVLGDNGDNTISGGAGNDTIAGGAGNDTIDGGAGNDTLDGGTGINTLSFASAASGVVVTLASQGTAQATGGGGTDTFTSFQYLTGSNYNDTLTGDGNANFIHGGAGNDAINGGDGNNVLYGDDGNDTIVAGSGVDALVGGAGQDTLTGGGGTDRFVYKAYSDSTVAAPDLITDFVSGSDKLDISALHQTSTDTYSISSSGGYSYVSIDYAGNGTVDSVIKLTGANVIKTTDVIWGASPVVHPVVVSDPSPFLRHGSATHHDVVAHHAMDHALYG